MHTIEQDTRHLVEALKTSALYKDYERAFSRSTGLPLNLQPVEPWHLAHHGKRHENPFCAIVTGESSPCADCLRTYHKLAKEAEKGPRTLICQNGLFEAAVPIHIGNRLVGFLQTGQGFPSTPTTQAFEEVAANLAAQGLETDHDTLRQAYFNTPLISKEHRDAAICLLTIFADHLSRIANQTLLQHSDTEPAIIRRAKDFIQEHHAEKLSLDRVAHQVNASPFHFSKTFNRFVGLNFTEYVSRVRVEKAKSLLLNPHLQISEIAFEIGFQSVTHFNRIFKRILGVSPSEFRANLEGVHSGSCNGEYQDLVSFRQLEPSTEINPSVFQTADYCHS